MSIPFETERLLLRTMQGDDLEAVYEIWGSPEVMKYCGGASTKSRIERSIDFYRELQNEKGYSVYTVLQKETSAIIGVCGFNPAEDEHEAELIYHFNQHYWGKGYAAEASAACLAVIRKNCPRIRKVIAAVDPANPASGKVLRKIGMTPAGMKWFEDTQQEELCFELELA
ncbi:MULTISPECIES: GNAT family N-acetyltransferase [unclassified Cytobacillus]|uniref:GNAT family N-acetyltransferase n=1 Tax=unclassified Cytobacillus TaxID=2675268 RepID=UPI00135CEA93|nr:GNAT family N-acetyltransferase [Cytobacillus sp. AMY 15.2]KAF0820863.1 acetyltransferase, GNAT family [Bacillus sp. ZZV12-4809]MCM3090845.1 GNAT family N-acetyltransferase [Cytobacillus sp. AMY 15.2]